MAEEPADPNEDFDNSLAEIISHIGDDDQTPVQRGELRQVLRAAFISERHAGPLPDPRSLERYRDLIPNGAERIMAMAEREQRHRHDMEKREQALLERSEQHDFVITRRGQVFGLGVCLLVIGAAMVFVLVGQPGLAALLVGLDLAALAAVFVAGRYLPVRSSRGNGAADEQEGTG